MRFACLVLLALTSAAHGASSPPPNPARLAMIQDHRVSEPAAGLPVLDPATVGATPVEIFMAVEFLCALPWQPEKLSVTVSDTRGAWNIAHLDGAQITKLSVPARQLESLQRARACANAPEDKELAGPADSDLRYFKIPNAFSAFGSLTCSADDGDKTKTTVTVPVAVVIGCTAEEIAGESPAAERTQPLDE